MEKLKFCKIFYKNDESIKLSIPTKYTVEDLMISFGYTSKMYFAKNQYRYIPNDYFINNGDTLFIYPIRECKQLELNLELFKINNSKFNHISEVKYLEDGIKASKCSFCDKESIVYEKLSKDMNYTYKTYRCDECYIEEIERKLISVITWYSMVSENDNVLVPLSGGKDGATEVYILNKYKKMSKKKFNIIAYTIKMEESHNYFNNNIEKAKALCEKLDVTHVVVSIKDVYGKYLSEFLNNKNNYWGPCMICTSIRQKIERFLIEKYNINKVTSGYTFNDQMRQIFWGIFFNSKWNMFKTPIIYDENSDIKRINLLFCLEEFDTALYTHILDLPVGRHYEYECPYSNNGKRTSQTYIVNKVDDVFPGILMNSKKDMINILENKYSRNKIKNKCSICNDIFYTNNNEKKICDICSVFQEYSIKSVKNFENLELR